MIITSNQLLAELQGTNGLNYSTLVLMEGALPSFSAVNSACRTDRSGGYGYVGTTVRDYLKSIGSIALSVSAFAPMSIANGSVTVSTSNRAFTGILPKAASPTWALLLARHAETSDFLNSQLVAHTALMLTAGISGSEDIVLVQATLPKGSTVRLAGIQLSSANIVG
jgi:hypothetical protein